MTPVKKVTIFLMMIGMKKSQNIIAMMDNGEIKAVIPEIRKITALSPEIQESVWAEFKEFGYEDNMNPSEVLTIIRFLFDGGKICDKNRR